MSREPDSEDTGSQGQTPPSPDPTPQGYPSVLFGGPMVSAPRADVRPRLPVNGYIQVPIPWPTEVFRPSTPFLPGALRTPYSSVGSAWGWGQPFRIPDDVSRETESDHIIARLRLDVEYERGRRLQCETRFQEQSRRVARQRNLYESQLEHSFQEQITSLRKRLDDKEKEATERTRQWRKAAAELNKLRASGQGFYQITDEYLVGLIVRLRFSIRTFALQYFASPSSPKITFFAKLPHYLSHTKAIMPGKQAEMYAGVHSKRNYQIIQAFIWRVLIAEVFNKFTWVGGKTAQSFKHLQTKLDPGKSTNSLISDYANKTWHSMEQRLPWDRETRTRSRAKVPDLERNYDRTPPRRSGPRGAVSDSEMAGMRGRPNSWLHTQHSRQQRQISGTRFRR